TATLSYQWRKGGAAIPGATSASYTINSVAAGDAATNYTVDVISNFNSTTATTSSNPTTLNVAAGISGAPTNQTALLSAAASFSVTATANAGATLTYQWRKDGSNLSGKTASTLSIASAAATDTGMYDVVITSSLSGTQVNTTSVPVSLNVAPSIPT